MRIFGFGLLLLTTAAAAQVPAPVPLATARVGDATGVSLIVTVKNITEAKGNLNIVLFTQEKGFPDDTVGSVSCRVMLSDGVRRGTAVVSFVGLKPGTYALSCFHDVNANDKLDTDFLGRPKEKWAMSRNPRPKFRAPRWSEAKFAVEAKDTAQTLELGR